MAINFKNILLAGTALVAAAFISAQAQAAQGAPGASIDLTVNPFVTDSTGTNGAPVAGDSSANIGGFGGVLTASSLGTVGTPIAMNATFIGGNGGNATAAGPAAAGGAAFSFGTQTSDILTFGGTSKTITGGNGGSNTTAAGAADETANVGGAGGAGILVNGATNTLTISNVTLGGNGGNGMASSNNLGGGAGAGGDGITASSAGATINGKAAVSGGNGGVVGVGVTGAANHNGTAGGIAYDLTGGTSTVTITANATGGKGATGGGNSGGGDTGGNGGTGGDAIKATAATNAINITGATTVISGGIGGNGGNATTGGASGAGGIGINLTQTAAVTIGAGVIVKGGVAGTVGTGGAPAAGLAGVGVNVGHAITTLNNSGTIGSATTETASALVLGGAVTTFANTGNILSNSALAANATMLVTADQTASFTNAGTITNASVAATATAVSLTSAQTGTFINSSTGTISAVGAGTALLPTGNAVLFSANAGALNNQGSIIGNISDLAAASTPTITNTGTILGDIVLVGGGNAKTITLTSGTVTGVGTTTATITMAGQAGVNTVSQAAGTVTGTSLGALLLGTGTNSFTQTGGAINSLASSATAIAITGGAGADTLTLGGGTIVGVTDLAGGANVLTVTGGTFSTGGAILATAGTIATTVAATGTFNVNNTYTPLAGALGITAGGTMHVIGANVVATGAVITNNGTLTVDAGRTVSAATLAAGTGTYNIGVSSTAAGVQTTGVLAMSGAGNSLATNTINFVVAPGSAPLTVGVHSLSNVFTAGSGAFTLTGATITDNSAIFGFALVAGTTATNADVSVTSNVGAISTNTNNAAAATTLLGINTATAADTAADLLLPVGQRGVLLAAQGNMVSGSVAVENNVAESLQPASLNGASTVAALGVGSQVQGLADTRIASLRSGDATSGVAAGAAANGWSMWLQGYGQHGDQSTKDAIAGYKADTWGGAVGVDSTSMISNGVLGVTFNYGRTTADSSDAATTNSDVDNYGFNVYGSLDLGQEYFTNGQLGYAYNKITSDRHNVGGIAGLTAHGDTSSDQYMAKLAAGRDFAQDHGLTLTPTVSAAYTHLSTGGYTETGAGGGDNIVQSNTLNVLELGVGVNAAWNLKNSDGSTMKPSVRAGYAYDALGDRVNTTSSFAGDTLGTTYTSEGVSPDRSSFDVGAGIVYATTANWDLSANYDYTYKQNYDSHTGVIRATSHF